MSGPFFGVFFHWLGGFASGSFYVPFRFVKKWSWEVMWLFNGIFSWIIMPWLMALILTNDLFGVFSKAFADDPSVFGYAFLFGLMWGMGGLTFGLTMRYLGMSLGMAVALGYCTVFGFLMPPLLKFEPGKFMEGTFVTEMLGTNAGIVVLFGVGICVLGIILAAFAGGSKEREMSEEAKKSVIKEFSFVKGLIVATFSGIMSAGMSYGMDASQAIADFSLEAGTPEHFSQIPRLCIILAGGFTSNFIWCLYLILKNKTGYQFTAKEIKPEHADPEDKLKNDLKIPLLGNCIFAAVAGTTWYFQFFFYSIGETKMGDFVFSSWPLHMASIMIFSSLWGLFLGEWKGSSAFTKTILFATLTTLIFSTMVIGYGTKMGGDAKEAKFVASSDNVISNARLIAALSDDDATTKEKAARIIVHAENVLALCNEANGKQANGEDLPEGTTPKKYVEKQDLLVKAMGDFDKILVLAKEIKAETDAPETVKLADKIIEDTITAEKARSEFEKLRKKAAKLTTVP